MYVSPLIRICRLTHWNHKREMPTNSSQYRDRFNKSGLKWDQGHPHEPTKKRDRSILHVAQISAIPFFCKKSDPARAMHFCISWLKHLFETDMHSNALAHDMRTCLCACIFLIFNFMGPPLIIPHVCKCRFEAQQAAYVCLATVNAQIVDKQT